MVGTGPDWAAGSTAFAATAADTGTGAAIRLTGVSRAWGATRALDDISLHVPPGSFTVLLGPSGCGKTTCLRIVAGLETATAGRIEIGGRDVTALPPAARGIAMVFQSYALFPHLSVAENITFGLKARRVPRPERAKRLARAAEVLGIEALLNRRPAQLSGGQQQRVALGRAIVAEAPVCLMDEPLSNLDAQLRADMRREILSLQRRLGITMLYVTHDQTEAMGMADQIVLLRDGRIDQDAPPATMYAEPATTFAASFIGTPPMNLFPLVRRGEGMVLAGTDGPVLAPAFAGAPYAGTTLAHAAVAGTAFAEVPYADAALAGAAVAGTAIAEAAIGGIRPEHLRLAPHGIAAHVAHAEYLGADTILGCRVGAATLLARVPGHVVLAPGTPVHLAMDAPVQVFDAATGRRCLTKPHRMQQETFA